MALYDVNGSQIQSAYDVEGASIPKAYDVEGNEISLDAPASSLKVMTYNVGQWYIGNSYRVPTESKSAYYALHRDIFSRHRPDVLFIQEYLNTWCVDGSSVDQLLNDYFTTRQVTDPTGYLGHCITTNGITISNYTSHTFTNHGTSNITFETAQISVDGKTINIINTHNDYKVQYQPDEIEDLLSTVEGMEYFILCGDFNINLSVEDATDEQYTINVKPFVDAGYNVGNCVKSWIPTYFGTSSPTGGKFCDQVITSTNITINQLYADTTKLTDAINDKIDHIPLIAELTIN